MLAPPPFDLVAFDLDGTLIAHHEPIWKTLHERLGSDPDRRARTIQAARAGRIGYAEWFAADLAMLQDAGARRAAFEAVAATLEPTPGARRLVEDLRAAGTRVVVLSGGLDLVMQSVLPGLVFDAVYINRIRFAADGTIAGGDPTPYDEDHKAAGLEALADRFGASLARTAFVGDGDNDIAIARRAGLSIAWGEAPDTLKAVCHVEIQAPSLDALRPHLLGA